MPIADPRRRRHAEMLVSALVVIVLAYLLQVVPGEKVAFIGFEDHPLPEVCPSRRFFDLRCPGCGLTRSVIHFAHGKLAESLETHRLGWLLAVGIAVQIPYRIAGIRNPDKVWITRQMGDRILWTVIAMLSANWLINAVQGKL